jgi:cytochrome P450
MLYWLAQTNSYSLLRDKRAAGDLEYLTAFRNECLRYCPPVEILPRKVVENRSEAAARILPDLALSLEEGKPPMVCPFVHRVHHDASVHANPDKFNPERFLGRSYRATEFLPFGLGRRFCLGAALGQRLMDRVLDRVLFHRLRFKFSSTKFRPVRRNVIIWPGVFMYARLHQDL